MLYFRDPDADITGALEDLPEREGDAAGLNTGRSYLVEQRLELVIVMFIDQHDLIMGILELLGQMQTGKTGTDYNDLFLHST